MSQQDSNRDRIRKAGEDPWTGGRVVTTYLARTSPASWPWTSSGMPSKTRLAPPSAHTRSAAGSATRRPPAAPGKQGARQSATYASARDYRLTASKKGLQKEQTGRRAVTAGPEEGREAGQRLVKDDERDGGGVGGAATGRGRGGRGGRWEEERRGVAHRRPLLRRRGSQSHGGRAGGWPGRRRGRPLSKLEPRGSSAWRDGWLAWLVSERAFKPCFLVSGASSPSWRLISLLHHVIQAQAAEQIQVTTNSHSGLVTQNKRAVSLQRRWYTIHTTN
jgi:hypothetical protein